MTPKEKYEKYIALRNECLLYIREQLKIRGYQTFVASKLKCTRPYVNQVSKGKNISDSELLVFLNILSEKNQIGHGRPIPKMRKQL